MSEFEKPDFSFDQMVNRVEARQEALQNKEEAEAKLPTVSDLPEATKDRVWNLPPSNHENRRAIRYRLFRIRENADVMTNDGRDDLKEFIESQFAFGMTWATFTFMWDLSPKDNLTVITEDLWRSEGGGYDAVTKAKAPTAFTKQAM